MLQYTADYFNVKHVLLNFLQGHSQPTLEMGTKMKTYHKTEDLPI